MLLYIIDAARQLSNQQDSVKAAAHQCLHQYNCILLLYEELPTTI
jgi:hypothetical protein